MTTHTPLRCANAMMATVIGSNPVLLNTGSFPAYSDYLNQTYTFSGTDWSNPSATTYLDANGPLPTRTHAMFCQQISSGLVLFGGEQETNAGGMLGDTWTYISSTWARKTTATAPSSRSRGSMAYNATSTKSVLFSGIGTFDLQSDTWVWDGTTWTQKSPATSPAARYDASMIHAGTGGSFLGGCLLFGGKGGNLEFNDLWNWNTADTNWVQLTPTNAPSCRSDMAMCQHVADGNFVMFGGRDGLGVKNDTYTLNAAGTAWTRVTTSTLTPPGRVGAQMSYSTTAGAVIMFGGNDGMNPLNDTWKFVAGQWTQL